MLRFIPLVALLALVPLRAAEPLRFGIIGLDTSHVIAFTKTYNDTKLPDHVPGGRVVVQDTNLVAPAFRESIGSTPIVSYKDAGLPETLRHLDGAKAGNINHARSIHRQRASLSYFYLCCHPLPLHTSSRVPVPLLLRS